MHTVTHTNTLISQFVKHIFFNISKLHNKTGVHLKKDCEFYNMQKLHHCFATTTKRTNSGICLNFVFKVM